MALTKLFKVQKALLFEKFFEEKLILKKSQPRLGNTLGKSFYNTGIHYIKPSMSMIIFQSSIDGIVIGLMNQARFSLE